MKKGQIFRVAIFSFLFIFGTACTAFERSTSPVEVVPTHIVLNDVDTSTANSYETMAVPSMAIPGTETIIPIPTTTPIIKPTYIPTLTEGERNILFSEWMETNAGCRLPCIWGLRPGQTKSTERKIYLSQFSSKYMFNDDLTDGIGFSKQSDDRIFSAGLNFYETNGEIERLTLIVDAKMPDGRYIFGDAEFSKFLGYYSLSNLLSNYGLPSQVLVYTWHTDPILRADYAPFSVVVIYENIGIMAEYISPNELVNGYFQGCPGEGYLTLRTWDPEARVSLSEIAGLASGRGISENAYPYFRPINEATRYSIEAFFEIFRKPGTSVCLETPSDLYPNPLP